LSRTIYDKEIGDCGKSPTLIVYVGNHVAVRRSDGSIVSTGVTPFPAALHAYVEKSKWDQALRLCRHIRVSTSTVCSCFTCCAHRMSVFGQHSPQWLHSRRTSTLPRLHTAPSMRYMDC
jgi:intraflagellar transport protein 80